jgi:hypothetical protein
VRHFSSSVATELTDVREEHLILQENRERQRFVAALLFLVGAFKYLEEHLVVLVRIRRTVRAWTAHRPRAANRAAISFARRFS